MFLTLAFYSVLLANKPVSPYSGYNGQLRSTVYQPTELAIISKGVTNVSTTLFHSCFAYAKPHVKVLLLFHFLVEICKSLATKLFISEVFVAPIFFTRMLSPSSCL